MKRFLQLSILLALLLPGNGFGKTIEYDLTIEQLPVTILNKTNDGMTINGGIPGPVLRFTQGDVAKINVHNKMDTDTSIHWHGLLVPPGMDGVPYMSFPPIKPGSTFVYEFPIRQSGTYWYHSHTHLQEQQGLYGAIVIEPKEYVRKTDQEYVVLLSDWTQESPDRVLKTLKSGSEWYAIKKNSAQSIVGAARKNKLGAYFMREFQRMPPMDIADVAYDYFLANGKPKQSFAAEPGQTVRLRVVNGSATTYFSVEFAGGNMQIINADGQDVHPISRKRFLMGVAETYDVIVTLPGSGSYEFRATAHDGSGFSSVWLGSGMSMAAPDVPKPNLYDTMMHGSLKDVFSLTPQGVMGMPDNMVDMGHFDAPGMAGMEHSDDMSQMDMDQMGMSEEMSETDKKIKTVKKVEMAKMPDMAKPDEKAKSDEKVKMVQMDGMKHGAMSKKSQMNMPAQNYERPMPPYSQLRSKTSTAFDPDKPVKEVRLTLDGDMERYVWFLNKTPLSKSDSIRIKEGEVVRFIMINRTMMHHPMHLHGHFFRVLNGQADYAPLKHTVDVAPMSTTVIEFDANEVGDWFFHCHLLYHMKSGMARMIHYENYLPSPEVAQIRPNLFKDSWYVLGKAEVLSNMTEGFLSLSNSLNTFEFQWEAGWQDVEDTPWEAMLTWDRYINRFFSVFGGVYVEGEDTSKEETKGIAGIHYLLPLNIEYGMWVDTKGDARFFADKEFQLTSRLSLAAEVQYDTKEKWETSLGLEYILTRSVSLAARWHSEYKWGAGLVVRF